MRRTLFYGFLRHLLVLCALYCGMWGGLHAQIPPARVFPQSVITLDSSRQYDILPQCEIFRDPKDGAMTLEGALEAAKKGAFTLVGTSSVRIMGKETVWLRFTVRNTKLTDWVLLAGNTRMDSVILFTPNSPSHLPSSAADFIPSYSGELTELRSRAMQTKLVALPLAMADDEPYTFYARITAHYVPAVPAFSLIPAETFTEDTKLRETTGYVLLGMLLFAAVFNIVPFFIVRDRVYAWYILHVLSLLLYTLLTSTLLTERSIPLETKPFIRALVQLGTFAVFMQFLRVFLDIRSIMPRLYDRLVLVCIIATTSVAMMIPLGWGQYYVYWRVPVLGASGLIFLVILIRAISVMPTLPGRIYALTMAGFVVLKFILFVFGILQEALITSTVGVGETMLFSFALAARITLMREQIFQEQQKRELAQKLQHQERIRNTELARANEEISRQNVILEEQSREIELTNTHLNEVIIELDTALHDLKETQTQLVASERIGAVGLLTAGVMHEINNPNAAIYAALEQMQLKAGDVRTFFMSLLDENGKESPEAKRFTTMTADMERMISIALEGSNRVKHIVSSLRSFTKHQEDGVKSAPLAQELAATVEMFRYQFKSVEVVQEFVGDTTIEANFGEINQVVLNLLVNAAQAGATAIQLVSTTTVDSVSISVKDNGKGIPPESLERMFEPFYTTKGAGNSGLGLSISKKILERHGAVLRVESVIGQGTVFTITFRKHLAYREVA